MKEAYNINLHKGANLQGSPLVFLRVMPRPNGQLGNKYLARFSEQDRSFCTNHLLKKNSGGVKTEDVNSS